MLHPVCRVRSELPMPKLISIPLTSLSPAPYLIRSVDAGELANLTESIRRHGLLQPVGVRRKSTRPAAYELLFGYRRFLACRALFLPRIPCLVFPDQRTPAVLSLCENFLHRAADASALPAFAEGLELSPAELCARLPVNIPEEMQKEARARDFSLFADLAGDTAEAPPAAPIRKGILRDGRLIANSIERAVCAGKDAGYPVEVQKIERAREIWYHIRLPRTAADAAPEETERIG